MAPRESTLVFSHQFTKSLPKFTKMENDKEKLDKQKLRE